MTPEQIKHIAIEEGASIPDKPFTVVCGEVAMSQLQLITFAKRIAQMHRELDANNQDAVALLTDLAIALDGAFISSWQSTAAWQKQLDAALDFIRNNTGE